MSTEIEFNIDNIAHAYNQLSDKYIAYVETSLARLSDDRKFIESYARLVLQNKNHQVCDLGCGSGYITNFLYSLSLNSWGLDISEEFIAYAQKKYPHLEFMLQSMDKIDIGDDSLGGVIAWYSLIHLPPKTLSNYIREFSRVLQEDGVFAIAFFESENNLVTDFDHAIAKAYRWPIDLLSINVQKYGFIEIYRMLRNPQAGERFPRGHLIFKKSTPLMQKNYG